MITVPGLASEALGSYLSTHLGRRFHSTEAHLTELIPSIARLSLECIGNSDALYHNVEHTMLVTLVGYDIMKGRALLTHTTPGDYSHLLVACLLHDIGYVRGILKGDGIDGYVIDGRGNKINVPRGSSDAALLQHHVDRSKLFVMDRLSNHDHLDAARIARAIEFTRFPASTVEPDDDGNEEGSLVRAADLIGQLGDPQYLRKANALYYEFEEVGPQQAAWLRIARRSHGALSAVLLEDGVPSRSDGHPISQRDVEWPAMDRKSLQQCLPCRARS